MQIVVELTDEETVGPNKLTWAQILERAVANAKLHIHAERKFNLRLYYKEFSKVVFDVEYV